MIGYRKEDTCCVFQVSDFQEGSQNNRRYIEMNSVRETAHKEGGRFKKGRLQEIRGKVDSSGKIYFFCLDSHWGGEPF